MRIAIALATYNGALHLAEQLRSLLVQTRPPDQVIINDDHSTDGTLDLITQFEREARFDVRVMTSASTQGPMPSFMRAVSHAAADVIAFCDQDDIWKADKLAICARELEDSGAEAVIHSFTAFRDGDERAAASAHDIHLRRQTLDGLLIAPTRVFAGMSMVVRTRVLDRAAALADVWEGYFTQSSGRRTLALLDHWSHAHDMYALTGARLCGSIRLLDDVLARKRLHDANASGVRATSSTQDVPDRETRTRGYAANGAFCRDFAEMLLERRVQETLNPERGTRAIREYSRWADIWQTRATLHAPGRSTAQRFRDWRRLVAANGYRSATAGGLGIVSSLRDFSAVCGVSA